jgi:hypothetical protein
MKSAVTAAFKSSNVSNVEGRRYLETAVYNGKSFPNGKSLPPFTVHIKILYFCTSSPGLPEDNDIRAIMVWRVEVFVFFI